MPSSNSAPLALLQALASVLVDDPRKRQQQRQIAFIAIQLVVKRQAVLFPRRIKQCSRAIRKHVEELACGTIAVDLLAHNDLLGVMHRQRTLRAQQTEERRRDIHALDLAVRDSRELLRFVSECRAVIARKKSFARSRSAETTSKSNCESRYVRATTFPGPFGRLLREPFLQNPHRLKKLEAMRFVEQLLDYTRIDSPLRGLHRRISSPVRLDSTTSCTKLFR